MDPSSQKCYLVGLFFLLTTTTLYAETIQWVGNSGSWHNPANWNPAQIPGPGDEVLIPSAATVTYNTDDTTITGLTVEGTLLLAGGSLTLTGRGQINGALDLAGGNILRVQGTTATLTAVGTITIGQADLYALAGGVITLPTTTQYTGPGVVRAEGAGSLIEIAQVTPVVKDIRVAVSREYSVFNGPSYAILDIPVMVSRQVSVYSSPLAAPSFRSAIARGVSVNNSPQGISSTQVVPESTITEDGQK